MADTTKELIRKEVRTITSASPHGRSGFMRGDGYLQLYLSQLQHNPLRTKMITSGTLSGLQEILASMIAGDRDKRTRSYLSPRILKMAVYGSFISAPLGHILVTLLQRAFAGRTSTKSKLAQILVSNLVVSPIQNSVYLACMALIAGGRTAHQILYEVEVGFLPVMKVSWCTSPLALIFAQKFLPPHAWLPFFNLVAFVIGTYINAITKKRKLETIRGGGSKKYPDRKKKDTAESKEYHFRRG